MSGRTYVVVSLCALSLAWAGCNGSESTEDTGGVEGDVEPGSDGSTADVASDAGPETTGGDVGEDTGSDIAESDAGSCEETWETGGGESRCCGEAELACSTFRFAADESSGMPSTYDPSSDVWTVQFDRSAAAIDGASVAATIKEESSGGGGVASGRSVSAQGSVEGSTITFDFSDSDFAEGEVLELNNLSVEDTCGSSEQFLIGTEVDPHAESVHTGFDCEKQPEFNP